ncbi:ferric reductase transmembrane protein [Novymonas esmeraldas]|uniref:Ferric reductase transmembrane protein n=1 Tax=Novymonas esmeraldas TaxID=1808958 RepID=A0AAW0EXZ2_9TRYP
MVHIAPLTLTAQLCYMVIATMLCIFFTIFGYLVWRTQVYFQETPDGYDQPSGFTRNGVVAVLGFFTFAGLAVALLVETSLFYIKYAFHPSRNGRYWTMHQRASLVFQALVGAAFVAGGVAALFVWGWDTTRCGWLFCLNTTKYPPPGYTRGQNFDVLLSAVVFSVLAPTGGVLLSRVVSTILLQRAEKAVQARRDEELVAEEESSPYRSPDHEERHASASLATEANPMAKPASMKLFHAEPRVKQVCRLVGVLVGILVYAIMSFWLPNDSRRFNSNFIAAFAKNVVVKDVRVGSSTIPEMPYAWFRTGQIRFSDDLTLKLFPGNVFFYVYLLAAAVIVFVLRQTQTSRYWVQRRIPRCACFTYGEAAFVVATTALSVMFFIYWIRDHNYKQTWNAKAKKANLIEAPERWGRALGQLAILFLSVLLLPVGRQSVVVSVLGVSRDGMLWFHRAVGYAMLAATIGHIVAFYVSYASFGFLMQNLNTVTNRVCKKGVFDDYSVITATWTTWFLLIAMGIFGLNFMRRRYYELFYYTHLAATYMTLPTMIAHASAGWMYLLPGMTIFLANQLVRLWQRSAVVRVVHARVISEDTTELAFSVPGRWNMQAVHPGQYVFVCVPELTALQWHPFTLTGIIDEESLPGADRKVSASGTVFYVHIKSMGPKTWTGRLHDLVSRGETITMAVEGPCGTPMDYHHYDDIVLVGGGIGAAPCVSIFGSLLRELQAAGGNALAGPRVHFIWSTRSGRHVNAVSDLLQLPVRCGEVVRRPTGEGSESVPVMEGATTWLASKEVSLDAAAPGRTHVANHEPAGDGGVEADTDVPVKESANQRFSFDVYVTREKELEHFAGRCARPDGVEFSPKPVSLEREGAFLQPDTVTVAGPLADVDLCPFTISPERESSEASSPREAVSFTAGGRRTGREREMVSRSFTAFPDHQYSRKAATEIGASSLPDVSPQTQAFFLTPENPALRSPAPEMKLHKQGEAVVGLEYSSGGDNVSSSTGEVAMEVRAGRPVMERLIREALYGAASDQEGLAKLNKARTMLFVCGPNVLVRQVIAIGTELGVAVHKEEFLF